MDKNKRLKSDDAKYVWHPYTQMKDCRRFAPILIEKAKGIKLYAGDGQVYYDTISSWWCNVHGHNHPKIKAAIKQQMDKLEHVLFAGFTHQPAIELAAKLVKIAPAGLNKVFFSDNGSTAVEVALKMSLQYWQNKNVKTKKTFLSFDAGYHGDTAAAMSVSGQSIFTDKFKPMLFKTFKACAPYCYRCPKKKNPQTCGCECVDQVKHLLEKNHRQICAIIIEPLVMAAGGMIVYPARYLNEIGRLTKKYDVHLILDEVATGFGRTGTMFACEQAKVNPDFICLSKGITSGYLPLAVTLTTNEVFNQFYGDYAQKKTFYHGHTYTANPIACAAGLASLNVFDQEKTLVNAVDRAWQLHDQIKMFNELKYVGDVRAIGLIAAIELVKNKKTKQLFTFEQRIGLKVYEQGLRQGIILRPLGNVVYLFLPLCVNADEVTDILERSYRALKNAIKD